MKNNLPTFKVTCKNIHTFYIYYKMWHLMTTLWTLPGWSKMLQMDCTEAYGSLPMHLGFTLSCATSSLSKLEESHLFYASLSQTAKWTRLAELALVLSGKCREYFLFESHFTSCFSKWSALWNCLESHFQEEWESVRFLANDLLVHVACFWEKCWLHNVLHDAAHAQGLD